MILIRIRVYVSLQMHISFMQVLIFQSCKFQLTPTYIDHASHRLFTAGACGHDGTVFRNHLLNLSDGTKDALLCDRLDLQHVRVPVVHDWSSFGPSHFRVWLEEGDFCGVHHARRLHNHLSLRHLRLGSLLHVLRSWG